MAQIKKKFIGSNEVGAAKIRLENAAALRARNAANSADIVIATTDSSDNILAGQSGTNLQLRGNVSIDTTDLDLNTQKIINLADPTSAQDGATKNYVDTAVTTAVNNQDYKASVKAATTANITLGAQTIDGVSIIAGDRVLVRAQSSSSANGIYVAAAGAWARSADADAISELTAGFIVTVEAGGTLYGSTVWLMNSPSVTVIGTSPITFLQIGTVVLPVWNKQNFTLSGTDITNQYVDLAQVGKASSFIVWVDGVLQAEGSDYNISLTGGAGGVTRLSFAGDLATGGNAALVATDVLRVQYQY